jgi:hypothetical protein
MAETDIEAPAEPSRFGLDNIVRKSLETCILSFAKFSFEIENLLFIDISDETILSFIKSKSISNNFF